MQESKQSNKYNRKPEVLPSSVEKRVLMFRNLIDYFIRQCIDKNIVNKN